MNRNMWTAATYLVVLLGLVLSGIIFVSWDRAEARDESWDLSWHIFVLVVSLLLVAWIAWFAIDRLNDGNSSNNLIAILLIVFGAVLSLLCLWLLPQVDWEGSGWTFLIIGGTLGFFAIFEVCRRHSVAAAP